MTFFKSRCYNGGNKHRFEARYTEESWPTVKTLPGGDYGLGEMESIITASRHTVLTYHNDICIWCGKISNKQG
jgi:hypothetical protein